MQSNIVMFTAPPRQFKESYRKTNIIITYIPDEDRWEWSFDVTSKVTFKGDAATKHHALMAAKKKVDALNE